MAFALRLLFDYVITAGGLRVSFTTARAAFLYPALCCCSPVPAAGFLRCIARTVEPLPLCAGALPAERARARAACLLIAIDYPISLILHAYGIRSHLFHERFTSLPRFRF